MQKKSWLTDGRGNSIERWEDGTGRVDLRIHLAPRRDESEDHRARRLARVAAWYWRAVGTR